MKIYMMACVCAFLFVAWIAFSESARASDCSELPADINIECFDATGLSDSQASFCGIWGESKWDNMLPHCLAVEKIKSSGAARIVYTWGKAPQWRIYQSGFTRAKAVIKENTLKSKLPTSGALVKYQLDNDKLRGEYRRGIFRNRVILKRFEK